VELSQECPACAAIQMARAVGHHHGDHWKSSSYDGLLAAANALQKPDADPGTLLTALYEALAERDAVGDPYQAEKAEANRLAEAFWAEHSLPLEDLYSRALYATAANALDGGVDPNPANLWATFESAIGQGFSRDDWPFFIDQARPGQFLLYLTDNAGEAVFDRELIRSLSEIGLLVVVVVRGAPYLNDLTNSEARELGLQSVAERLIDTGTASTGFMLDRVGEPARREFERADLIVAKGIANLETLSHRPLDKPAIFLYRSKCPPAARLAGVSLGSNVAWMKNCDS